MLFRLYTRSHKCFTGEQAAFQKYSKYDKKGWHYCVIDGHGKDKLMTLHGRKKHLKDFHSGLDFTIEIQICLIRKDKSTAIKEERSSMQQDIIDKAFCEFN